MARKISPVGGLGSGLALGALTMFLLDPVQGRTRRARLRDKAVRLEHMSQQMASATRHDMRNRARGLIAELRGSVKREQTDDDVLVERVRSRAGRLVSHPHALHIEARDGVITLSGHVLTGEIAPLLTKLRAVRGVEHIDNQLTPHDQPYGVPALQGGHATSQPTNDWSPAARLLAAIGGAVLLVNAIRKRRLLGLAFGGAGTAALLRGLTNLPVQRWIDRTIPRTETRVYRPSPTSN